MSSGQKNLKYDLGTPANRDSADQPMGSDEYACGAAAPFSDSTEDETMDSGVDKRSRESPDSTLKPEGKLPKTSEAAPTEADTSAVEEDKTEIAKPSATTKRPTTIPEAKSLMWDVHHRMPAWKAEKIIETLKSEEVDLAALGEVTGIMFESKEMWCDAVQYLKKIREEKHGDLAVPKRIDPCSTQSNDQDQDTSIEKESNDFAEQEEISSAPAGAASAVPTTTGSSDGTTTHTSKTTSVSSAVTDQQPDANASSTDPTAEEKKNLVSESHKDWFSRVTGAGQEVLRHAESTTRCPTLLTGVQPATLKDLETLGWEDKLEIADLEKHMDYLRGRHFLALPHPLEATAWENGFIPETHGLLTNELESRILPLLPQLSHMVAAPRQPPTAGDALLTFSDERSANAQAVGKIRWAERSITKRTTGSQAIFELAATSYSVGSGQ